VSLRPRVLEDGHTLPKRLLIRTIERLGNVRADDVVRVSIYRPSFFGRSWMQFVWGAMRGPSEWTPGERELLAAFTSRLNRCPYCVGIHTETATLGLARPVSVAMLDGWRETDLDPRLRAAFELLERRAAGPAAMQPGDFDRARQAGLTDAGIDDVLAIGFTFDLINRLADTFGFTTVDEPGRKKTAAMLYRSGYRMPGFLLR